MNLSKKLLSAFLACAFACVSAVPSVAAVNVSAVSYDNTEITESKEGSFSELDDSNIVDAYETPFNVFEIYDAYKEQTAVTTAPVATTTFAPTVTTTETTTAVQTTTAPAKDPLMKETWGIDVSQWQGSINWSAVKQAGVDFAIVRAGYGRSATQEDPYFDVNVQNAKANGIDVGVYWYSYAQSVEEAKKEAEVCYSVIKDYSFEFPIYFDIEDPTQEYLSTATISAMVDAFCSTLESKGYYVGVYSSAFFLSGKIYQNIRDKYSIWVAHFGAASPAYYSPYGIWQYTSTGRVNGINGNVDLNHCYFDYPAVVVPNPRTPGAVTTAISQNTVAQTTQTTAVTTLPALPLRGIDVSENDGDIDWGAVAKDGVHYAIARLGYTGEDGTPALDTAFEKNLSEIKSAGLGAGAYWQSKAVTKEAMQAEAEFFYSQIKDTKFDYPVYLDMTDSVYSDMTPEQTAELAKTFCSYIEGNKFFVGIRASEDLFKHNMDSSVFELYDVWIVSYGDQKPSFFCNYGMWQYAGDGSVAGVEGTVGESGCYKRYPSIMTFNHLNNF